MLHQAEMALSSTLRALPECHKSWLRGFLICPSYTNYSYSSQEDKKKFQFPLPGATIDVLAILLLIDLCGAFDVERKMLK